MPPSVHQRGQHAGYFWCDVRNSVVKLCGWCMWMEWLIVVLRGVGEGCGGEITGQDGWYLGHSGRASGSFLTIRVYTGCRLQTHTGGQQTKPGELNHGIELPYHLHLVTNTGSGMWWYVYRHSRGLYGVCQPWYCNGWRRSLSHCFYSGKMFLRSPVCRVGQVLVCGCSCTTHSECVGS